MKRNIGLLFIICLTSLSLMAQVAEAYSEDVFLEKYQRLMANQQFDDAKQFVKSNRPLFDNVENGAEIYNIYMGITAMSSYMKTRIIDTLIVDLPYIDYYMSAIMDNPSEVNPTDMWSNLYLFSEIYKVLNNPKIETIYQFATEYYKSNPSENYRTFHLILDNVAFQKINTSQFQDAIIVFSQDHELLISNNDATIDVPRNLCIAGRLFLHQLNDKEKAKNCLLESYRLYQNFKEETHNNDDYYFLLTDISSIFLQEANLQKSMEYAKELRNLLESDNNTKSEFYIAALMQMSNSSKDPKSLVQFAEEAYRATLYLPEDDGLRAQAAEKLRYCYTTANTPADKQINIGEFESIKSEDNLSLLYIEAQTELIKGEIKSAKEKFLRLLEYYESSKDAFNDEHYTRCATSLMNIYVTEGNHSLADQIYWRASNFYKTNGFTCNYERHFNGFEGLVHYCILDFVTARSYLELALKQFNEVGDNQSIDYISCLNNLALVYIKLNEKAKARVYIDESRDLIDEIVKMQDKESLPLQLTILNNIGLVYDNLGNTEKSIEIYKEVLGLCVGEEFNEAKCQALANLAIEYVFYGRFSEAMECYEQLMSLPLNGNMKLIVSGNILWSKYLMSDESAIQSLASFNDISIDEVANVFGTFTDTERENYWDEVSAELLVNNMVADKFPEPKAFTLAYDNALFCKSLLLKSSKLFDEIVTSTGDAQLIHKYSLAKKLEEKVTAKSTQPDSLSGHYLQAFQLKKQVLLSIPNFKDLLKSSFAKWQDVQQMLSKNDIAIEFVVIPRIEKIGQRDLYYGALVLGKDDASPRLITLCNVDSLKTIIRSGSSNDVDYINKLYSTNDQRLYNLILKNLESWLKPETTIYYSPTGYINTINLNAISNDGKRMSEYCEFYQVSSTSEISTIKQNKTSAFQSAIIYGNIDYGETPHEMEYFAQAYSTRGQPNTLQVNRGETTRAWGPLTHTKEEAETINNLFSCNNLQSRLLMSGAANEESFKALNGNAPDIIHVATHGFYIENKHETPSDYFGNVKSFTSKGRSMIFSGLLFAGANNIWTGNEISSNTEDGILTALEIGQLDLSDVQVVALSACQTALGDIDDVNGVLGLQRGFKQAGVKTIVMSLWEVPDAETCELMTEFYRILLSGVEKHEAFRQAQKKLQQRKPDPYFWAAFVLLD